MNVMKLKRGVSALIAAAMLIVCTGAMHVGSVDETSGNDYIIHYFNDSTKEDESYFLPLPEENISTFKVYGLDERKPYTHSGVVDLVIDGSGAGTGFIVGDHTIATAAHCVYEKDQNNDKSKEHFFDSILAIFHSSNGNPISSAYAVEAHIMEEYKTCASLKAMMYDYALITVEADLSSYEHFELGEILNTPSAHNLIVNVCGFPGREFDDDGNLIYSGENLYISSSVITTITDRRLGYYADTSDGQSGSPVFVTSTYQIGSNAPETLKTVVGIHTREGNSGVRITSEQKLFYLANPYNTYEKG